MNRLPVLQVGQEWSYRTRPREPESTLVIGRIEHGPGGRVVHISVRGLRMASAVAADGIGREIDHLAITEEALRSSIVELRGVVEIGDGFEEGYLEWFTATDGKGRPFWVPVADVVEIAEGVANGPAA
jgi:hypothetical protein